MRRVRADQPPKGRGNFHSYRKPQSLVGGKEKTKGKQKVERKQFLGKRRGINVKRGWGEGEGEKRDTLARDLNDEL